MNVMPVLRTLAIVLAMVMSMSLVAGCAGGKYQALEWEEPDRPPKGEGVVSKDGKKEFKF